MISIFFICISKFEFILRISDPYVSDSRYSVSDNVSVIKTQIRYILHPYSFISYLRWVTLSISLVSENFVAIFIHIVYSYLTFATYQMVMFQQKTTYATSSNTPPLLIYVVIYIVWRDTAEVFFFFFLGIVHTGRCVRPRQVSRSQGVRRSQGCRDRRHHRRPSQGHLWTVPQHPDKAHGRRVSSICTILRCPRRPDIQVDRRLIVHPEERGSSKEKKKASELTLVEHMILFCRWSNHVNSVI